LLRNAQKRDKKETEQNNRGRGKKTEETKPHFVMSPDGFFRFSFRVFEFPCYETLKKRVKKIDKKIKIKIK
jgi:hypothetical protein